MSAGDQTHRGRDVDAADKEELKTLFRSALAEHKENMTELFDVKLGHQAGDIEELKQTTSKHTDEINTLKTFKEGHQNWHRDNMDANKFRWEIVVALGSVLVAIAAIFFGG